MGPGNLVKVKVPSSGGGAVTMTYIVSEANSDRAINIIRCNIAQLSDEVTAVSRVSEELLMALGVAPGQFTRVDSGYFKDNN